MYLPFHASGAGNHNRKWISESDVGRAMPLASQCLGTVTFGSLASKAEGSLRGAASTDTAETIVARSSTIRVKLSQLFRSAVAHWAPATSIIEHETLTKALFCGIDSPPTISRKPNQRINSDLYNRRIMEIAQAQEDVRRTFLGGFAGQL